MADLDLPHYTYSSTATLDPYRLKERFVFDFPIRGHQASVLNATLSIDGKLYIHPGFRWDLASGAIDTPDMVVASLAHDALCRMTDSGALDYKYRKHADKFFRQVLKMYGCSFVRRWYAWAAVRTYSIAFNPHRWEQWQ